jgi:4-diphosphocytidyl-2-C-methyl-D-erythritol kinase
MTSIVHSSPAKVNLALHILGRRADGYHELETLMAPLDFGDEIALARTEGTGSIRLACSNPALACDQTNLVWRAADAFRRRYGRPSFDREGLSIHITKKIPMGAGLGGGSSNAAAALRGMRELFEVAATDADLMELGAGLGSDVPFFVVPRPAWCRGRGERIEPALLAGRYAGLLVHPGFGVSTPWAYKAYASNPGRGETGARLPGDVALRNDLEPAVFSKHLWLPACKAWFREQPEVLDALMSGSGSSIFAILKPAAADADSLRQRFLDDFGSHLFAVAFKIGGS